MNETSHVRTYEPTRVDEWVDRFRMALTSKVNRLDQPTVSEIDRVAVWLCEVRSQWQPEQEEQT